MQAPTRPGNTGYVNASQCYVILALPLLFYVIPGYKHILPLLLAHFAKEYKMCEISGFRRSLDDLFALLGRYATRVRAKTSNT